jgi:hypothetical protein
MGVVMVVTRENMQLAMGKGAQYFSHLQCFFPPLFHGGVMVVVRGERSACVTQGRIKVHCHSLIAPEMWNCLICCVLEACIVLYAALLWNAPVGYTAAEEDRTDQTVSWK